MPTDPESPLKFPCKMTLKIMGRNNDAFEIAILSIVREHFPTLQASAIKTKLSSGDKYLSLSITVNAESKAQMDALYLELTACEQVLFVL